MQLKNFACICVPPRACVCTQKIKRLDASGRKKSVSWRVFWSRTFGMYYTLTIYLSAQDLLIHTFSYPRWQPMGILNLLPLITCMHTHTMCRLTITHTPTIYTTDTWTWPLIYTVIRTRAKLTCIMKPTRVCTQHTCTLTAPAFPMVVRGIKTPWLL